MWNAVIKKTSTVDYQEVIGTIVSNYLGQKFRIDLIVEVVHLDWDRRWDQIKRQVPMNTLFLLSVCWPIFSPTSRATEWCVEWALTNLRSSMIETMF